MSPTTSLIIPTHNRSASLKRLLDSLRSQTCPWPEFEVIVAADGCRDQTANMVRSYEAPYSLSLYELPGLGAASARNLGASMARGHMLLFLDDDMEPSSDFIRNHQLCHSGGRMVVIGYSPLKLAGKPDMQRKLLKDWWGKKFQEMKKPGHQFAYDDLTSGNFSIPAGLFRELNGFDAALLCREDYELGFRLIQAGAKFRFCHDSKAFHCDDCTDLPRSLQRKKMEGVADIQIGKKNADFRSREALHYLSERSLSKFLMLRAIQYVPGMSDHLARMAAKVMNVFERFNLRSPWMRANYLLHRYWYMRGLMDSFSSVRTLYDFIFRQREAIPENEKLSIDLKQGLQKAEEELNRRNPLELDIYFGTQFIGTWKIEPGTEPISGTHLRKGLKERFSKELSPILFPEDLFSGSE